MTHKYENKINWKKEVLKVLQNLFSFFEDIIQ